MSKKELWLYSLGAISVNLLTLFFTQKIFFFYDPKNESTAIIPLAIVTGILVVSRLADAITDPIISLLNERLVFFQRMGVCRAPILFALPFLSFAFYLLWHPHFLFTAESPLWVKGVWLLILINIYFISFTFISTAYDAYLAKIAQNDRERLTVSQYKTLFASLGVILALPFISYHDISLASNGILVISIVLLAICCLGITKDKNKAEISKNIFHQSKLHKQKYFSLANLFQLWVFAFKSIKIFKDKKYLYYFLLVILLMDAGVNIFLKNLDYYIGHVLLPKSNLAFNLVEQREQLKLILFASFSLSLLIALPFWKWYAQKNTMLEVAKIGLFFLMFLFPSFLFFTNHIFSYILIVLIFILIGFFYSAFTLVAFAFLGQFVTGEKQVGLLFGLNIFVKKIGLILGLFLFSLIVEFFTFLNLTSWSFKSMGGVMTLLTILAYLFFRKFAKYYSAPR